MYGANGEQVKADLSFLTGSSVMFDAVYVPGGEESVAALRNENEPANFLNEAYQHCKTIAASGAGVEWLKSAGLIAESKDDGKKSSRSSPQAGIVTTREDDVSGSLLHLLRASRSIGIGSGNSLYEKNQRAKP